MVELTERNEAGDAVDEGISVSVVLSAAKALPNVERRVIDAVDEDMAPFVYIPAAMALYSGEKGSINAAHENISTIVVMPAVVVVRLGDLKRGAIVAVDED